MIDPTSSHRKSIPRLPFHLSILNKPLTSLIHTDTQLFTMIIDSLKQYEPYSIPFLHKVSKRDVPNYFEYIKNPMDLGTLQRNIKKYDRASFMHDLNLIWDNCVFFNGPSIYTDYAEKMRERANYLFEFLFTREVRVEQPDEPNYFMESVNFCEEIVREDSELDSVDFKYQNILDLGHFSKRIRFEKKVELGRYESKRVLEQVIVIYIGAMGFKKVEPSAIQIFADVIYNLIYRQCLKSRGKITKEMRMLTLKDLEIIKLPEECMVKDYEDVKLDEEMEIVNPDEVISNNDEEEKMNLFADEDTKDDNENEEDDF